MSNVNRSIYIDEETWKELVEEAEKDKRSVNNYIIKIIENREKAKNGEKV
jgi:predicted HicB family RNase H-like nuclease